MIIDAEKFKKDPNYYIWRSGSDQTYHRRFSIAVIIDGITLDIDKEVVHSDRKMFDKVNLGLIELVSGADQLTVDAGMIDGLHQLIDKTYRDQKYSVTFVEPKNVPYIIRRNREILP